MNYETIVARALIEGTPEARQLAEDRITLKTLVCQEIMCRKSGRILDQRSAVAVEIHLESGAVTYQGPYAPEIVETPSVIRENMARLQAENPQIKSFRVLVGAELFGKRKGYHSATKDRLVKAAPAKVEQGLLPL